MAWGIYEVQWNSLLGIFDEIETDLKVEIDDDGDDDDDESLAYDYVGIDTKSEQDIFDEDETVVVKSTDHKIPFIGKDGRTRWRKQIIAKKMFELLSQRSWCW